MILRAFAVWLALAVVAIANGAFREALLVPRLGAANAHVVSTAMLCVAILAIAFATVRWVHPRSTSDAALVGTLWVVLVLLFEFGFGRFVARKPWAALLADYNLADGRVWVFVPALTWVAPLLAARARKLV